MKHSFIIIFTIIALLSGCLDSRVVNSLEKTVVEHKVKGIAFLAIEPDDNQFADCIREKLEKKFVNIYFLDGKVFRDRLYPWFEPESMPKSESEFLSTLKDDMVKKQIDSLNIDLLICIKKNSITRTIHNDPIALHYLLFFGSTYRETDISISIWNLNDGDYLGEFENDMSGTAHYGLIGIFPYFIPMMTETAACEETSKHISNWLIEFGSAGNN